MPLTPAHAALNPPPQPLTGRLRAREPWSTCGQVGQGALLTPVLVAASGLCVLENQFSPRTSRIREPWCRPCLLSWGSTLRPWEHQVPPPKCLQIGLSPRCLPQPQGCAAREGFSCSQKCSPALFTQHNSDIQGRGWVTAGTARLQRLPQVSRLTLKQERAGVRQLPVSPPPAACLGPSARTACSPHRSHHPAPSRQ